MNQILFSLNLLKTVRMNTYLWVEERIFPADRIIVIFTVIYMLHVYKLVTSDLFGLLLLPMLIFFNLRRLILKSEVSY